MALELYNYWDSVCSFKCRIALEEKGLSWIDRQVDLLKFEQLQPEYLRLNPNGLVPTLVHDGQPVIESTIINEYLDEVFPDVPLRPADPRRRAEMRVWVKFEDDALHPAVRPGTFNLMIKSVVRHMPAAELDALLARHPKPEIAKDWAKAASAPVDEAAVAAATAKLEAALTRIENTLARQQWLAGETYSLADIAIAPMIDRIEYLALAGLWRDKPHVTDWIARIKSRPAFRRAIPARRMRGPMSAAA